MSSPGSDKNQKLFHKNSVGGNDFTFPPQLPGE
jgi:hypothetical protein